MLAGLLNACQNLLWVFFELGVFAHDALKMRYLFIQRLFITAVFLKNPYLNLKSLLLVSQLLGNFHELPTVFLLVGDNIVQIRFDAFKVLVHLWLPLLYLLYLILGVNDDLLGFSHLVLKYLPLKSNIPRLHNFKLIKVVLNTLLLRIKFLHELVLLSYLSLNLLKLEVKDVFVYYWLVDG